VPDAELVSSTRKGKIILNVGKEELTVVTKADGDMIAVVGDNRKLLFFKIAELPEMARGKGVKLQSYKDGHLVDLKAFKRAEGFFWFDAAGRQQSTDDWKDWIGKRAQSGRMVPRGFNKNGMFTG
jgi:topoisomerase-4 subunit A